MTKPTIRTVKAPIGDSPWLLPAAFVIASLVLIGRALLTPGTPLLADTDDAMRLVIVRDFLAGQPWYDLVQHRLNTPFGAEVHWSRLVDLPIATLILVLRPVLGADLATIATAYAWPLCLLGALLAVSAGLTRRLVGPAGVLPALVLPLLSPAITTEFAPGRLDHHNVEILLTLLIAWTTIEALERARFAWLAGLLCATALAIATESIPAIAAAITVFGALWVISPGRAAQLREFGVSFGMAAVVHLALTRPPSRWLEPACDMISPVYAGGALIVMLAFSAVTMVPAPRRAWLRFLMLAGLGALGLAALLFIYPQCLDGPYGGLDPWLRQHWIGNIAEAKPWIASLFDLPAFTLATGLPVVLAIVATLARIMLVTRDRAQWLALLAFLVFAALIMLMQVRGARLAVMPAVPAAAWVIALAWRHFAVRRRPLTAIALVASCLVFAGSAIVLGVDGITTLRPGRAQIVASAQASKLPCLLPTAFADLAALPPERIMTPIDLGSHMLLQTPHAVVSAPYHRDAEGVRDTFDFFNLPIGQARLILQRRGIGLVVTCPAMAEMVGLPDRAADSFSALAKAGALPAWLPEVSLGGPLKIYAVLPP
ncbi:hypothetical protein [uncultured Devosia sp.]|uniref:hypothetical protein n=1 Tax=uncultured Devosia sp. TaxID=211434 RepID=UPI0035C9F8C9